MAKPGHQSKRRLSPRRQFTALYAEAGAASGDVVLLILRHGVDAHAAFIGAMLGGFVPSFLPYPNIKQDHDLYWRQHHAVFQFCQPRLIVAYDELYEPTRACAEGGLRVSDVQRQTPLDAQAPSPTRSLSATSTAPSSAKSAWVAALS
ncbi:MAG: hypothetical protein ABUS57_11040 [Pseudomonadota bacterium]